MTIRELLRRHVRTYRDFPKEGILFRDMSPILEDCRTFQLLILLMTEAVIYNFKRPEYIAAIESRGFILGAALAKSLNCGLILVRKAGKLPGPTIAESYDLEYGSATLEIHDDVLDEEDDFPVLIVDDLLATGGTAQATYNLIKKAGGNPIGAMFAMELRYLDGAKKLDCKQYSVLSYDS